VENGVFAKFVVFKALWLPPAHIWASETTGANLGIRFAALYAPPSKHVCPRELNVHVQVPTYGIKPHHVIGSVSNRVRFRPRSRMMCSSGGNMCPQADFFWYHRLEAYFHTCDELLHMWAHAEDLDTLEFALMQVTAYIAGPVRIPTIFFVLVSCGSHKCAYPGR
jgi:hypothetical protein